MIVARLTPMASANWLPNSFADAENARISVLDFNSNGLRVAAAAAVEEEACCGGLNITAPVSWREHERRRLQAGAQHNTDMSADGAAPVVSADSNSDVDTSFGSKVSRAAFSSGCPRPALQCRVILPASSPHIHHFLHQAFVAMVVGFLQEAACVREEEGGPPLALRDQVSTLLCAMNLLLHHPDAHDWFVELQGYAALSALVVSVVAQIGTDPFPPHDENSNDGSDGRDGGNSSFARNRNNNYCAQLNAVTCLVSLVLGQPLDMQALEAGGDVTYLEAVRRDLLVKNTRVLDIAVYLVSLESVQLASVGIACLDSLLRLSPLSVVALQRSGGVAALGGVVLRTSLLAGAETGTAGPREDAHHESSNGENFTKYFNILLQASNVLVKVAVLDSEVNAHVLSFFAFILHENASLHLQCLCGHPSSSSPVAPVSSSARSSPPRCVNCEMETACHQCTDGSCISDEMSLLCMDCDKVFHKSVLKRNHIRVPVIAAPISTLVETMGEDLRRVVEEARAPHPEQKDQDEEKATSFETQLRGDDDMPHDHSEFSTHSSCLLLSHLFALVNDRQVRPGR
jgi:hypothetical protein